MKHDDLRPMVSTSFRLVGFTVVRPIALAAGLSLACGISAFARVDPPKPAPEPAREGQAATGGGQLTIDKPVVDVGDVVRGRLATAVFEVRNTGNEILKILEAKPG